MKPITHIILIFFVVFLVLISHSTSSARFLPPNQDVKETKISHEITHSGSSISLEEDDLFNLMGLEECEDKDEECVKRRMVEEAHLDYIYTQHHKPKSLP